MITFPERNAGLISVYTVPSVVPGFDPLLGSAGNSIYGVVV